MTYDTNHLVERMRSDAESDWPSRLLRDIANAPTVEESDVNLLGNRATTSHDLSPSELRVLECLSRGMTVPQTAEALFLAIDTIKSHTKLCRFKLRAKNTTHACCEALRLGVIR